MSVRMPAQSFAPEVRTHGDLKFYRNACRYATREEAEASALELQSRWMMVTDTRATEAYEQPNYRFDMSLNRSVRLPDEPESIALR